MFIKQQQTFDSGWSCNLGFVVVLNPQYIKPACYGISEKFGPG
jgi:hypothetical protein